VAQLELVLMLLSACVALRAVGEHFAVPHPTLLVLGGALVALAPGLPRPALDPDVIFLLFVPPLLYRASSTAPLREFRRQFWPIFQLSVPLVLGTMVAVAAAAHAFLPGYTWPAAFVLGAIVSAPDPVAAMAVIRPLRVPAAVTAVLEGEGIFNDATALTAYRMAVAAAVTGTFSLARAGTELAWSAVLGLAVGLLVGWGALAIRRRVQDLPLFDNSISLLTPFAAYLPATALGASGVLAVVAAGIYVGRQLAKARAPATRIQADATWALVIFLFESLAFILIGLELPHLVRDTGRDSLGPWLGFSALITLVVIFVRIVWLLPAGVHARRTLPRGRRGLQSRRQIALVAWTGVRGVDSVVIALALPAITAAGALFPARGLTIFITFGVVFATLVLQGLTVKPLVRLLGLDGDNEPAREEAHARQVLAKAGLRRLEELAGLSSSSTEILEHFRQRQRRLVELWSRREELLRDESIAHLSANDGDGGAIEAHSPAYRRLRAAMIAAERHAAVELCEGGLIGTELLRRLQRDLDLETIVLGDAAHDRQDPEPRQQDAVFR